MEYIIDLKGINNREELHSRLAEILKLPDYYGKNLDAFYDSMSERRKPEILTFTNLSSLSGELKDYFQRMKEVLTDLRECKRSFCFRLFENEKKPVKAVIFDIGNVLIRFSSFNFIEERYGEEMGLRIAKAMYGEGRWVELDRGIMTDEEVLQTFFDADPGIPKEYIKWCFDNVSRTVQPCGYAIPWLREIKRMGKKIYYLSNYSKKIMYGKPEVLNFLPLMDGGIFSCDVKLIKPDRAIFELLLKEYGLSPEECLFLDDTPENCRAALSLNINPVLFEDPDTDRPLVMEILKDSRT